MAAAAHVSGFPITEADCGGHKRAPNGPNLSREEFASLLEVLQALENSVSQYPRLEGRFAQADCPDAGTRMSDFVARL